MTVTEEWTTHELHALSHEGDTKYTWDPENAAEIDVARKAFNQLKKKGFLAYTVEDDGGQGEVIREFDPQAGRIIMTPPQAGG